MNIPTPAAALRAVADWLHHLWESDLLPPGADTVAELVAAALTSQTEKENDHGNADPLA